MRIYQNSVQLIGLGSAGTNVVEAFLANKKTKELLENDLTRLSLLAIDIADPEIRSLKEKYEQINKSMIKAGIPAERLRLIAEAIKFPTAETMYDFINQKYGEYVAADGTRRPDYISWLQTNNAIPPMAGGAGRRRSLAKAIYELNYYQLGIVKNCISIFKEQALSSIITPTIFLVYGLGGGTGSGVFFDFARHLRKVLGSGVPIIALVITPCGGDDPPAKGSSAFVAMNELLLLQNKNYNETITKTYGDYYGNPLNALIYLPLLPAFSKLGNVINARKELDDMVVDILYVLMDFDIADLISGIGTDVGLINNSIHTLSMFKVNYPVEEYISAFKFNFEYIQLLQGMRVDKLNLLEEVNKLVKSADSKNMELLKTYLLKTGRFSNDEDVEKERKAIIKSNPNEDEDTALHVKLVENQVKNWLNEMSKFLYTIRSAAKAGPIEEAIVNLTIRKDGKKTDSLEGLLTNLTKTYLEFNENKIRITERLKKLIPTSQILTLRQKRIVEDVVNIASLAEKSLDLLKEFSAVHYTTDELIRLYEVIPESKTEIETLKQVQRELDTIYLVTQLLLRTPVDESKMIDEHSIYIEQILSDYNHQKADLNNDITRLQEEKKRFEFDKSKLEKQLHKVFAKKAYAKNRVKIIERDLRRITEEQNLADEKLSQIDRAIDLYQELASSFEVTSDYRKRLSKIVNAYQEYHAKLTEINTSKRYYEKSADLTVREQSKILYKILTEQENSLSPETVYKDIFDKEHFKDYIRSVVRSLKTPSIIGYKPTYKTDYIWVTVSTPSKMWTEDMTQEIYTSLAGYVTSEVSRSITVRVVESRDPWTTKILVVGGRGRPEDLEVYDEMQLLHAKSSDFEKNLSRSYFLEYGVHATEIVKQLNHTNGNGKKQ